VPFPAPVGTGRPVGALIALIALTISALPARAQAAVQVGGVIEGTLHLDTRPPRKTAPRYPGTRPVTHTMQPVSAVVYLTGTALRSIPAAGPDRRGPTVSMAQRGSSFVPSSLAVTSGTAVVFPNADPYFHNVFSYTGSARFDLGRYPAGASRDVTFDQPGIVMVSCEVHDFMRALILVTDHGFHAVVTEDGTFRITDVPAGEYTLTAYHPDYGALEERVIVTEGQTVTVRFDSGG
jgi:plastocyanin